jgi:hypothetical protein
MPDEGLGPDENIDPVAWAELQRRVYRTSLKCWWSREFGYLSLLDPFTGEVFDIESDGAPKWMKRRAFEEKAKRRDQRSLQSPQSGQRSGI